MFEKLFDDPDETEGGGGFFNDLLNAGVNIGKSYLPGQTKPSPQTATQPAPVAASPSWIKWAVIGGVALLLVVIAGVAFKKS